MEGTGEFTARASLAVIGHYFMQAGGWAKGCQHVMIKQKVIAHEPLDKLLDCFVSLLAGGRGLCQIETWVKQDAALRRAFGSGSCADPSTVNDTLNLCSTERARQMEQALREVLHTYGQCCRHDYTRAVQVLDGDMTGWPGGRTGEGGESAYFADQAHRRGRQLGRGLATAYQEVVCDRLYPGQRQLATALADLGQAAEGVLGLDGDSQPARNHRENTVLRVDGGGGSEANINWMLARNYLIMVKLHNAQRARKLVRSVAEWMPDPKVAERAIGWVRQPTVYAAPPASWLFGSASRRLRLTRPMAIPYWYWSSNCPTTNWHRHRPLGVRWLPPPRSPSACGMRCTSMTCGAEEPRRSSAATSKA
jgi:hypothetical protein